MTDWISIEDTVNLPADGQDVFLLIKTPDGLRAFSGYINKSNSSFYSRDYTDFYVYLPYMHIQDKTVNIHITFSLWHICGWDKNNKVTHWMPIPKLPTSEVNQ